MVRMARWTVLVSIVLLADAGCGGPTAATPTTGLTGTVVRSPVTPVCSVTVPCSAPFSAGFTVDRNGTPVAHFRSDSDGRFTVTLSPATYHVVPDSDAPIIAPTSQVKTVTVQEMGLTSVALEFDTGIR
jgi:hypothetical protein